MSLKKGDRLIISYFAYSFFRCDSEDNLTPEERKELLAIQAIGDAQRYSGKYLRVLYLTSRKGWHMFKYKKDRDDDFNASSYIIYSANFDNVHLSTREK